MTKNIFISYSRREVGFVDDLTSRLEVGGNNVWLDYRSLVPGSPWEEQIYQGIMNSEIILLVVSKSSIASQNVEMEWRRVLGQKKRIILLIFETVDLPPELESYEWVDFRGDYEAALKELNLKLELAKQEERPAPETGFKAPGIVWAAFVLSVITSILSLGALWTLFIPFFLLPLPVKILRRSFNYLAVQSSLVMLPFALYLTTLFSIDENLIDLLNLFMWASIPFAIAMVGILRSRGMQRWGKPEAVSPNSAHRRVTDFPEATPVTFFMDHAPQDRKVADEMRRVFGRAGHTETQNAASAHVVLTLISRFKNDSSVDCEKHVVYPVIVQSNSDVSKQISRIQWLDMRWGIRNLESVAKLLPHPSQLLRGLCIRPMGNQVVLPAPVLYLSYFLAFLAIVCIGSWFPYVLQYADDFLTYVDFDTVIIQLAASLVLFGALSFFMIKNLVERRGPFSSLISLILGMLALGGIIHWQIELDNLVFAILDITVDYRGFSSYYPWTLYWAGNFLMLIYLWFKRMDLMYWFPAKK